MKLNLTECRQQVSALDDSLELARQLREIADGLEDQNAAYILREAAGNLRAQFSLIRSLMLHVDAAPGSGAAPAT